MRIESILASVGVIVLFTACNGTRFVGGDSRRPSAQKSKDSTKEKVTTQKPTTQGPTTQGPTTQGPTTQGPTTQGPTTQGPTTQGPTTQNPTTQNPTTQNPTTQNPTTQNPTTQNPTTQNPTTQNPTTQNPVSTRCTSGTPFNAYYQQYGGASGYWATLSAILTYEARIQVSLPIADGETKACFLHAVPKAGTYVPTTLPVNRGFVLQSASSGYAFPAGDQTNCTRIGNYIQVGPMGVSGKPLVGYAPVPTVDVNIIPRVLVAGHMKPDPSRYDAFPLVTMRRNVCFAKFDSMTVLFKDQTVE